MFKLVIQDDEGKTTVVPLIRDEITIGRKEGNTIRLTERNVSRRHARIVRMNGTVAIEDLGSYNGVRVNGTRIAQRTALTISDRVQIGDYLIELKAEGAEVGAPTDDGKTQPIERMDPALLARGGMPTPVMVGSPHATMVALADTDPNQRAANIATAAGAPMAVAPMTAASGFARLVILSSNFAGQEFELTKPQMIVGRTDDNDIVVNHRSISRNHAKVVREADTGRYTISDLASSNGVRVNGEEYGKVELRRGDTVDLGHVRMRFVEAGEDFLFGRDAQAVDVPTGGGKKGLIIGLVGLLAVGGIIIAVVAGGGGSKGGSGSGSSSGTASASAGGTGSSSGVASGGTGGGSGSTTGTGDSSGTAGSAAASGGTGSAVGSAPILADAATQETGSAGSGTAAGTGEGTGTGSSIAGDAAKKAEECKALRDAGNWTDLAVCATDLNKLDPTNADAKAFGDMAAKELHNKMALDDLAGLINKKDWGAAKQACDKLDEASVYKDKLHQLCDKAKSDFISEMTARAHSLASRHQCKDIAKLGQQSGRYWPEAKDAVDGVSCTEQVATNPGGSNTHPGSGSATPPGGSGSASAGGGCSDTTQLMDDARAAAKNTQWGKALRLCEQTLACSKGDAEAVMVCALAACNMKNTAKAKLYIGKLSSSRQSMARQSCLRNGIDPGGG